MNYEPVYRKYADAIRDLISICTANDDTIVPIGLDGAVISYLTRPMDPFRKLVAASSKTGEIDIEKIDDLFRFGDIWVGDYVRLIDLRSKTGKLGSMLSHEIFNRGANPLYTVCFDPNGNADERASLEPLEDHEVLRWCDPETYSQLIYKDENGKWIYNIDEKKIAKFDHVREIRKLI